jgi:mono/diheme cytochrome c family protein
MKRTIALLGMAFLLFSCGGEGKKEKKDFEYNRIQKTEKKISAAADKAPVDLSNKGIGPISDFEFPSDIDADMAAKGSTIFKQKCTACHYPDKRLIGPAMTGIYERRHPAWVLNMLLNPTEMLEKDPVAMGLLKEYNNVIMLNQNLSQEEARAIAEYLRTL